MSAGNFYYKMRYQAFAAATDHLSCAEVGIYVRLLNKYYDNQGPIDGDIRRLNRVVHAETPEEKDALRHVLSEFFEFDEIAGVFYHNVAQDEIERVALERQRKAIAGAAGGNAKAANAKAGADDVVARAKKNVASAKENCSTSNERNSQQAKNVASATKSLASATNTLASANKNGSKCSSSYSYSYINNNHSEVAPESDDSCGVSESDIQSNAKEKSSLEPKVKSQASAKDSSIGAQKKPKPPVAAISSYLRKHLKFLPELETQDERGAISNAYRSLEPEIGNEGFWECVKTLIEEVSANPKLNGEEPVFINGVKFVPGICWLMGKGLQLHIANDPPLRWHMRAEERAQSEII